MYYGIREMCMQECNYSNEIENACIANKFGGYKSLVV
jgi:hypothetical protein